MYLDCLLKNNLYHNYKMNRVPIELSNKLNFYIMFIFQQCFHNNVYSRQHNNLLLNHLMEDAALTTCLCLRSDHILCLYVVIRLPV